MSISYLECFLLDLERFLSLSLSLDNMGHKDAHFSIIGIVEIKESSFDKGLYSTNIPNEKYFLPSF